jgi:hypothetical protein
VYERSATSVRTPDARPAQVPQSIDVGSQKGGLSGSNDLLGDLVAKARQGARGETGARQLLERESEMRYLTKKSKIIAAAAIIGLASSGGAYAYWTTTGSGSGSATTATTAGTLSLAGGPVGGLVPGGTVNVAITATNPAATTSLTAATLTVAGLTSNKPACNLLASTLATAVATSPGLPVTVAPGGGTASFGSVTVSLPDSSSVNQDACQGATYTFTVTAS